ncbi:hypothetical protein PITCH_A1390016 [uncultured Desulfobacterium sp.]|uniref:Uncharacterized protein n=1 Tax=uncultured Desulfobacterium sp. TaxID=201089 RepID=A0A445MST5_9BACT|nr:hypothetical protein PITCH_A1390016 [uncultured Desulfobacterium sp.]
MLRPDCSKKTRSVYDIPIRALFFRQDLQDDQDILASPNERQKPASLFAGDNGIGDAPKNINCSSETEYSDMGKR